MIDNNMPKLECLSYYKQALSNLLHSKEVLVECCLLDNDLRLQFLILEKNLTGKIFALESDIQNGLIF